MNHLSDEQLNEYLDGALDERLKQKVTSHLEQCFECRARLDELQWLFFHLASLQEVQIGHDLTPGVLAQLPTRPVSRLRWLALGMQGLTVLVALIWLLAQSQDLFQAWISILEWSASQEWTFQIPSLTLEAYSLTPLLTATAVLWLVGNLGLLRSRPQESRR